MFCFIVFIAFMLFLFYYYFNFFCTFHWADLSWLTFHYLLYPVWLCMWQIIKNLEPSLTPVCIFWCAFKPCICKKLFPHKEHECGFSFEWTFRWPFRLEAHKHFKVYVFLLGQIYTEDILLLDALLCHVWWGRGVSAGKYCEYFSYAWVD